MAVYGNMVITNAGKTLYGKVQTGTELTFTRMQIGSGSLGSTDPTTLTALISPIDYITINSISTTSGTANILGIYQNTNLTASTYTCEIGLFAQDPTAGEILYAYANAGAQGDTIPPYADGPYSRQFQINTAIGNATTVTANIPSGTYVPTTQVGASNGVASLDANSNVVQMLSVIADIFGAASVVLSGGVATKDATTATQLDVTAANVYFATGEHINFAASTANQFKTSTANTTYYLDYNNDGTTSWGTAHSTKTGYVPICSLTTDASGSILSVTDARPLTVELFNSASKVDGSKLVNLPLPSHLAVTNDDNDFTFKQTFGAGFDLPSGQAGTVEGTLSAGTGGTIHATNSDELGGYSPSQSATPSTVVVRDANGIERSAAFSPAGLTGATAASRYVGATTSGAPTSGTFLNSDFVIDQTGYVWVCTMGGSPGTWKQIGITSSASGVWAPAAGTFNVAVGTVINIASVPSGAHEFYVNAYGSYAFFMLGATTPSGTGLTFGGYGTSAYSNVSNGISSTSYKNGSSQGEQFFDGTYEIAGYIQVNNGYLQLVVTGAPTTTTGTAHTYYWGVS